jgi:GDPmannose 4,6-dehydratase
MGKKIAFITGITGQDGSYLAELLIEKGYIVHGIVRRTSLLYTRTRLHHIRDKLTLFYGDMNDGSSLANIIAGIVNNESDFEVFEIYNLAAQSHVKISFEIPEYTSLVDGIGTLKLLEAIRMLPEDKKSKVKFYQAGTSEMYGAVLETPQNENTPFNPQSPYACAKVYSHFLVKNYREGYGMFACNGILFNHESSRRGENFVTMKIVNGIKKIMEDNEDTDYVLELGNIYSKRDWGHSKDYVYGMWLMLQQESPDDYVLATGETFMVKDFINMCFKYVGKNIRWEGEGINEVAIDNETNRVLIKINEKYFRPCDVELLLGDPTKAIERLNWNREYNIETLIDDMFGYKQNP